VINNELEGLQRRILSNRVPERWLECSYPSVLSLAEYVADLRNRVIFMEQWIRVGPPSVFRLGAFFQPEEFLTSILQIYARKRKVPFDSLRWKTEPLDCMSGDKITNEPKDGVYIEGLAIDGAKWNGKELTECELNDLKNSLPFLHLLPTDQLKPYDMNVTYECPVYRTTLRGTGALDISNYIMSIFL